MKNLLAFRSALDRLGKTNPERAAALNIQERTLYSYKAGKLPPFAHLLLQHPTLIEALLEDARAGRTTGNHDPH